MSGERSTTAAQGTGRLGLWPFVSLLLVAIPFFVVTIPPSTDLPQHVAQIRLFHEALGPAADLYRISWLGPGNLVYVLLGVLSAVFPPEVAGRMALLLLALGWVGATAWLARTRGRSTEAAVLAALFAFQPALYWGFLNFLVGWPVFACWLHLTTTTRPDPPRQKWAALSLVAMLLYASHILWFAVGIAWLILVGLGTGFRRRTWWMSVATLVPAVVLAAVWFPEFYAMRSVRNDVATHWDVPLWTRLSPTTIVYDTLGGVTGLFPLVAGACVTLWFLLVLITRRRHLIVPIDRPLLLAAGLFAGISLLAPDRDMSTLDLANRWTPLIPVLLLLALPEPLLSRRMLRTFVIGALGVCVALTTFQWMLFEWDEMSGFQGALAALPPRTRVLELDFIHHSDLIRTRPFMQMAAWAQAEKGCELGFSFAEHGSSVVTYRKPREISWGFGLEWIAEGVTAGDVAHFDYVLVNGRKTSQEAVRALPSLVPVTAEGRWQLYRVAGAGQ